MAGEFVAESSLSRILLTLAAEGLSARPQRNRRLISRFHSDERRIVEGHRIISELLRRHEPVPAETEWLLDNYYVIDEVIRQIHDHMPSS